MSNSKEKKDKSVTILFSEENWQNRVKYYVRRGYTIESGTSTFKRLVKDVES